MAKKAFEDGFYEVSLGLLERFMKNYPASGDLSEARLLTAQCYFHQNKFFDALNKLEALSGDPQAKEINDAVIYWIAEVHFRGNNFPKAREYYQKVIDIYPKSYYAPDSLYSLGWCFFQEGSFGRALEYFKLAEEKFPKENFAQDANFKVIECLYNLKDYLALKEKLKNSLKAFAKDTARLPYLYFYLGETEYYLNNFNDAVKAYAQAAAFTGEERIKSLCRLGIGWSHLKLKQYTEAENNFLEVKREKLEKPGRDILLLGKAVLSAQTARFSEAEKLYQELIDSAAFGATLAEAYLGQADAFYNLAEYKQAISAYQEALLKVPQASSQDAVDKLHYGLAWAYLKDGSFKEAIDEFQKVAKLSDDKAVKVSALCQIGDAYQDNGDFNKAMEAYDTVLKNYPDSIYSDYVQYQLGLASLKLSNYDGAILAFKTLKNNFSNSKLLDDASYALGLAYFQKQDYSAAKETFEIFSRDFKDSSLDSQAMYLLASSLYNLGKFSEAIEVFKDIARAFNQDNELVQKCEYEIADCFYQLGNEKEAMERFKSLRAKYPDSSLTPEVMWWLGEYYYRHNQMEISRRYFSSLIRDFPETGLVADAYYALASSFSEEARFDEAVDNFKKVIELGRSDLAGTSTIAVADIYFKQGRIEEALAGYKAVVENYPNLSGIAYPKIAEAYYEAGNYDEAQQAYKKSMDLVPVKEMASMQFRLAEAAQKAGHDEFFVIAEYLKVPYLYSENKELTVRALLRVAAIYEDKENFKEASNVYKKVADMGVEESKYANERLERINKEGEKWVYGK